MIRLFARAAVVAVAFVAFAAPAFAHAELPAPSLEFVEGAAREH